MSFTGHFLSDVYSYLVTFYIWLLLISGYQTYLVIIDIWLLVISGYQTYLVISNIWLLDISGYDYYLVINKLVDKLPARLYMYCSLSRTRNKRLDRWLLDSPCHIGTELVSFS